MSAQPENLPLVISPGLVSRDGLYVCGHCHQVHVPSQREIDLTENAPAGSQTELKCRHCKHWTVVWHPPTPPRQIERDQNGRRIFEPVSQERGRALFAELKLKLSNASS